VSKKSNPALIGSFVIGAIILLVAAALLFGGSELLTTKIQAVTYFPGSVKGLRVGSNVTFRGVRIGYVKDIQLQVDAKTLGSLVQVTLELLPEKWMVVSDGRVIGGDKQLMRMDMEDTVKAGLRAKLNVESFVTGQLLIDLNFLPDTPEVYRGRNSPHIEIPSSPSDIEQVVQNVQQLVADIQGSVDIKEIAADVGSILNGIDELVNSSDIRESLAGVNRIVNDEDTQALTGSLQAVIDELRSMLTDTRRLVNHTDEQIGPLIEELMPAVEKLDDILAAGQKTLENASNQIRGDTEFVYELNATLDELQGAARSLRIFLDFIERNPEALIRGKQPGSSP